MSTNYGLRGGRNTIPTSEENVSNFFINPVRVGICDTAQGYAYYSAIQFAARACMLDIWSKYYGWNYCHRFREPATVVRS